jgi:hypothetical protein
MHVKRDIGATHVPMSGISPTTPPPIPTKPMVESAPVAPAAPPKSSPEKTSPFTNVPVEKSTKLAALEASGYNAYVLVSSPAVCGVHMSCDPIHMCPSSHFSLFLSGWLIPEGQNCEREEATSYL